MSTGFLISCPQRCRFGRLTMSTVQAACAPSWERVWTSAAPAQLGRAGSRGGISITFWFVDDNPAKPGVGVQLSHLVVSRMAFAPAGNSNHPKAPFCLPLGVMIMI